ncbi:hypothetical protein SDC9_142867 [bioreactor metagenome]|uniref:Uncharacterized protein n=1 Tax=bioreactor metagenome TaxID=1076179 RepID=A0A645E559_9ZZZZ
MNFVLQQVYTRTLYPIMVIKGYNVLVNLAVICITTIPIDSLASSVATGSIFYAPENNAMIYLFIYFF